MQTGKEEQLSLHVNGTRVLVDITDQFGDLTLLHVLREQLNLTGAKEACDNGECGSCIVTMNGKPVKSCLLAAKRAANKPLVTVEGLSEDVAHIKAGDDYSVLHPIQQAFLEKGATQCGFCIPGMIMKTKTLLDIKPNPSREEIIKSLSKNLCRCTGYTKIIDAVSYAAELINEGRNGVTPNVEVGCAVGHNVARLDSPGTVTGSSIYAADMKMPGMLYAKLLRSEHHHARIISIDVGIARAMPGVIEVITAEDIPGTPYLPNCQPQIYVFPTDRIRFKGEALAAVAAETEAIAVAALALIKVEVEVLPHAIEIDDASAADATPLFDHSGRISPPEEVACGDIEVGFDMADVIVEREYSVPVREHAAMEPEAALAYQDEASGQLVIHTGLYHAYVQGTKSIANNLGIEEQDVRIICPTMGGNFGTRGDTLIAVVAGLLTRKTCRPVRMVFSRAESILGSCKAPSVNMRYRTGATKDGRIVALDVDVMHGSGSWAPFLVDKTTRGIELCFFETLGALLSHTTGPYSIEHVRCRAWDVLTNSPRFVPLRGTNANYLPLAYESQIDLIAEALNMDPLKIRQLNAIRPGDKTHFGQVLTEHVSIAKELDVLEPHYQAAQARLVGRLATAQAPWKPGLGLGCGWRNIGYFDSTISAGCELLANGKIHVMAGSVEQGQGPTTQFLQIAADVIGITMTHMCITLGDTTAAPYPVPTFSSISTVGTGKAVFMAAEGLKAKIVVAAASYLAKDEAELSILENTVQVTKEPEKSVTFVELSTYMQAQGISTLSESQLKWSGEAPSILYGYNAGLMELDVNTETGKVRLLNHVNVCDPGTIINPQAVDGQVDGAIAFGIGFALTERFHPDNEPTLSSYGIPSSVDIMPQVKRLYVEDPLERGPFGAKSMAEHPGISIIPAIINGIANATGARVRQVPATSEVVVNSINRQAATADG
jgi:CO/xanthine dehydrogenase Mo-binding subunit/aerobic-type carbon monoxide dehydrogenase small subunit (CoxS/CutS family)